MVSPIDLFFKMGDKATRGDPNRQQDFMYYMLWILFLAFAAMFIANLVQFIKYLNVDDLIWAVIGFAIASLQYFNLKQMYELKKIRDKPKPEDKLMSPDDMLKLFKEKEVQDNVRKESKDRDSSK